MKKHVLFGAAIAQALLQILVINKAMASDIEWNGFGSAYYTQSFSPEVVPPSSDTSSNFTSASNFGLNVGSKLSEKISVAAQLVALNSDPNGEWAVTAKWAFLNYRVSESFGVRIGRQLVPALLAAEFQSVGYLMPYRIIPRCIFFLLPVSGFNGISATYNTSGFWATAFGGRPDYDFSRSSAIVFSGGAKDLTGAAVGYDGDGFGLRLQWNRARPNLTITAGGTAYPANGTVDTYTLGYRFDKFGFVSWAEYGFAKSEDGSQMPVLAVGGGGRFVASMRGGYVLLGYKLGDFLPRYTFSRADLETGIRNGKTTSHVFGFNYNVNPQVVAKVEYEIVTVPEANETGAGLATRQSGSSQTSGNAIFAGLDFVF